LHCHFLFSQNRFFELTFTVILFALLSASFFATAISILQRPKSNSSTRQSDTTPLVLQSLSRPVSDYRQSVQDLHSAVDRVLSMYAEINRAHTNLSQSFAGAESVGNESSWRQGVLEGAEQAQELSAITGVLSDLKIGLSKANTKLLQATSTSESMSTMSTMPTMLTTSTPPTELTQFGASWASLPPQSGDGAPPSSSQEVPAILEQYSDMLVSLVTSKMAAAAAEEKQ